MASHFLNTTLPFLILTLFSLFPLFHSLSTFAISETTGNQSLICAITQQNQPSNSFLNCTTFPQRTQIQFNAPFSQISAVVSGNGFLCALTSFNSSSIIVCWRFSNITNIMNTNYTRIYNGPVLRELNSGSSRICGLTSTNDIQCWPWRTFNSTGNIITSNLAVGQDFVCGLSDLRRIQCLGTDANVVNSVPNGEFSQIAAGNGAVCGVLTNGSLECWGNNVWERPQGEFTSLALGQNRGCAIMRPNGTVVCWGENGFTLPNSLRNESFISLDAKTRIFCGVLTSNYSLVCWGNEEVLDSSSLIFDNVVPGPCRIRDECSCDFLGNYGRYCPQGMVICQPCDSTPPLRNPPLPPSPLQPSPPVLRSTRRWNGRMVAFLVVGCVGSFSLLVVVCVFLFSRYIKITGSRIHDSGRLEEGGSPDETALEPATRSLDKKLSHLISIGNGGYLEEFPLQVLLEITENFSEEHKIGFGNFGSVYQATLDDGRQVAIKRAETSSSSSHTKQGQEDKDNAFLNELEFLSRLNHKNLVRLLGYCEESNERVLLYEYMSNGTLHDHLHKLETSPLTTTWAKRINVALDAARGIEYLHEYAVPRIIHRDIKSSNILLDATWTAKVSDFGLSLLGPQDDESHLSLRAAGTMGYMDPEYYRLQMLTTKSDVYSFGIVLLELLSGCKAIHKNENGVPRNVVDHVIPYVLQDEIHRILDRRVPPPTPFEIEAVAYVGYLAADCVMPEGRDRPTMSDVVNSLDRALEACLAPPSLLSRSTTHSSI